jgi:hypothetical protein
MVSAGMVAAATLSTRVAGVCVGFVIMAVGMVQAAAATTLVAARQTGMPTAATVTRVGVAALGG